MSVVVIVAVVGFLAFRTESSDPQLSAKLLSANQVPSGWLSENFQSAQKGTGCLASAMNPKGVRDSAEENVLYVNDGSVPPEVGEEIATFHDVKGSFRKIISSLGRCTKIHGDNPGAGIYGSIVPLPLPIYGELSGAVVASISDDAVPITLTDDVIFIEKGKYVVEIFEVNMGAGSVRTQQFEKYVTKALSKL